jgi:hypothetical protein
MLQVSDLVYGEQLVVWASRRWLAQRRGWDRVAEEFALSLGCGRARVALDALEQVLNIVNQCARGPVYLHRLECCRVSADEQALLGAVAALQAADPITASTTLEMILPPTAARMALGATETLAGALGAAGCVLPRREEGEFRGIAMTAGSGGTATLH